MELTVRLKQFGAENQGTSAKGEWKKMEIIVETTEQYPKTIAVVCWNELADTARRMTPGNEYKISFSIESREYNGKWYTDVKATSIESGAQRQSQPNVQPTYQQQPPQPQKAMQQQAAQPYPYHQDVDLPF